MSRIFTESRQGMEQAIRYHLVLFPLLLSIAGMASSNGSARRPSPSGDALSETKWSRTWAEGSAADESLLVQIADKHSSRASGLAQLLLMQYRKALYDDVLVNPENLQKSARRFKSDKPKMNAEPSVRVYPNPADDHVVIELRNWKGVITLMLLDMNGKTLLAEEFRGEKSAYLLETGHLSKGTYQLILSSRDGKLREVKNIAVQR